MQSRRALALASSVVIWIGGCGVDFLGNGQGGGNSLAPSGGSDHAAGAGEGAPTGSTTSGMAMGGAGGVGGNIGGATSVGAGGTGGVETGGSGGTTTTTTNPGDCVVLGGTVQCNPITNQGCSGTVCDWVLQSSQIGYGFQCWTSPSVVATCDYADPNGNAFCVQGSTYNPNASNRCQQYCCETADCLSGVCGSYGLFVSAPNLGLCSCP